MVTKPKKLTTKQWAEIRSRWENDPREGYAWVLVDFDLPVTSKAILMKAKREGWTKLISLKKIAEQAHKKADDKYKVDSVTHSVTVVTDSVTDSVTTVTNEEANKIAVDLRSTIVESHRDDWAAHREQFTLSQMTDIDVGKAAKVAADVIKLRQEGERKAWGLDVIQEAQDEAPDSVDLDKFYADTMAKMAKDKESFENRTL